VVLVTAFIVLGAVALLGGLSLLVTGIRRHKAQHPRHIAMLIGGMMMTAFGLIIAGFAIAYENAPPLDLNTGAAQ
jgi:Ca2+/H+ antiporter